MLAILLLAYMTIQGVSVVKASPTLPKIFVAPKINNVAPPNSFTIDINVSDISATESLYGWEFEMHFNTSFLDAIDVDQGPFLKSVSSTFFTSQIDNPAGTVNALCMINFPYPEQGAVGNGNLCNITFQVGANGATLLRFVDTELDTIVGMSVVPIDHEPLHGWFEYPPKNHDVIATSNVPETDEAYYTWTIDVNVTVENQGEVTENINITAYYNASSWEEIGTISITLASSAQMTVTFSFNLGGAGRGDKDYIVMVVVVLIYEGVCTTAPDSNVDNNVREEGQVRVPLWGDVDDNGVVNILDLKKVKLAYSKLIEEPMADIDGNGKIDILDVKKEKLIYSGLI